MFSGHGYAQAAVTPDAYRGFALKHDGNIERGREVFTNAACALCHTVDGRGGRAGPDLFAVGDTTGRGEIIDAILEPSATIAVGYGATIVEMKSGETFNGVIKEANEQTTAIMGADGTLLRLVTTDIKEQRGSLLSLMPQGLHAALSLPEFTDLIEYLASLKQPEHSLTSNRGMPNVIPTLAKPVVLRPVFEEALRFPATFVHQPGDVRSGLVCFVQVPGSRDVFLAIRQSGEIWRLEKKRRGIFQIFIWRS